MADVLPSQDPLLHEELCLHAVLWTWAGVSEELAEAAGGARHPIDIAQNGLHALHDVVVDTEDGELVLRELQSPLATTDHVRDAQGLQILRNLFEMVDQGRGARGLHVSRPDKGVDVRCQHVRLVGLGLLPGLRRVAGYTNCLERVRVLRPEAL